MPCSEQNCHEINQSWTLPIRLSSWIWARRGRAISGFNLQSVSAFGLTIKNGFGSDFSSLRIDLEKSLAIRIWFDVIVDLIIWESSISVYGIDSGDDGSYGFTFQHTLLFTLSEQRNLIVDVLNHDEDGGLGGKLLSSVILIKICKLGLCIFLVKQEFIKQNDLIELEIQDFTKMCQNY